MKKLMKMLIKKPDRNNAEEEAIKIAFSTGLIQAIEVDGRTTYNLDAFFRFWRKFMGNPRVLLFEYEWAARLHAWYTRVISRIKSMFPSKGIYYTSTVKGDAFMAAVESGLLTEIEKDGESTYNHEVFDEFWRRLVWTLCPKA